MPLLPLGIVVCLLACTLIYFRWRVSRLVCIVLALLSLGAVGVTRSIVLLSADCTTALTANVYYLCLDTPEFIVYTASGAGFIDPSGGGGGGGDISAVGNCTTGACFGSIPATQALMGGTPAAFRVLVDADVPNDLTADNYQPLDASLTALAIGTDFLNFTGPASTTKTFTLPNASSTILTSNAAVTVAQGGTGVPSGTSGGVPFFSGSATMTSSAALADNAVVIGGGVGAAPETIAASTTTTHSLFATATAPAFRAIVDGDVPDTLTASNYLPLVGGTLTGQLVTDNLGIELDESDTNPTCAAGNYTIFADVSEAKLKACQDGVASDLLGGGGGAGDIEAVGDCASGACFGTVTATHAFMGGTPAAFRAIVDDDVPDTITASNYQPVDVALTALAGGSDFVAFSGPATSTKTFTLPNASSTLLSSNAAVTVAQGGTGIASGTSGGVPYFSDSTTIASSAALAVNGVVIGGGAGAAPASVAASTTTTEALFATAGAPAFRALVDGDVPDTLTASNYLPLAGGTLTGALVLDDTADCSSSVTLGETCVENASGVLGQLYIGDGTNAQPVLMAPTATPTMEATRAAGEDITGAVDLLTAVKVCRTGSGTCDDAVRIALFCDSGNICHMSFYNASNELITEGKAIYSGSAWVITIDTAGTQTTCLTMDDTGLMTFAALESCGRLTSAGSMQIASTQNAAGAITIDANGGGSETVLIRATQGTAQTAINIRATVGGITLNADDDLQLTADAVNITGNLTATGTATVTGVAKGLVGVTLDTAATVALSAATDCGRTVRISDDAGPITYTLPGAVAGCAVCFYAAVASTITVDPVDGVDTIILAGTTLSAGDAISSPGALGDSMCLLGLDATRWSTWAGKGTWIDAN